MKEAHENLASKILEDDTGYEVEQEYRQACADGLIGTDAANKVLESMQKELEDVDEGPIIYLVLAYLLHCDNQQVPKIRDRAIDILSREEGLDRWMESSPKLLSERKSTLNALLVELKKSL